MLNLNGAVATFFFLGASKEEHIFGIKADIFGNQFAVSTGTNKIWCHLKSIGGSHIVCKMIRGGNNTGEKRRSLFWLNGLSATNIVKQFCDHFSNWTFALIAPFDVAKFARVAISEVNHRGIMHDSAMFTQSVIEIDATWDIKGED